MIRTLVIHEGSNEAITRAARKISLFLVPCKIYRSWEIKQDILKEDDVFVIGGMVKNDTIDSKFMDFITANREWLSKRQVALFASGGQAEQALVSVRSLLGDAVVMTDTIDGEDGRPDTQKIIDYGLKLRDINQKYLRCVPDEKLLEQIEEVLASERNCTFTTGYGSEVRGTIISYVYKRGYFYFLCEGSIKFATLLHNDKVCITVCKEHRGHPHPAALQVFGKSTIHYPGTETFKEFVAKRGANYERVMNMAYLLNGIEVKISHIIMYWSNWRKLGYDARQTYYF